MLLWVFVHLEKIFFVTAGGTSQQSVQKPHTYTIKEEVYVVKICGANKKAPDHARFAQSGVCYFGLILHRFYNRAGESLEFTCLVGVQRRGHR